MQGSVSVWSPSQASGEGAKQLRTLNLNPIPHEHDAGSLSIQSPQSDHSASPPGMVVGVIVVGDIVVGAEVVVLMVSLLISCFFPVFLYIPFTVHPFSVSNEIGAPVRHLDFFGLQFGTTFETLLQSSS